LAKIIVAIEIDNVPYKELKDEVIINPKKGNCVHCWYTNEDGDKVVIDEAYLNRSYLDDSFYAFEVIDVIE
jgi:hypothetical protein